MKIDGKEAGDRSFKKKVEVTNSIKCKLDKVYWWRYFSISFR